MRKKEGGHNNCIIAAVTIYSLFAYVANDFLIDWWGPKQKMT